MKNNSKSMDDIRHKIIQKPRISSPTPLQKPVRQIDSLTRKVGHNMDIARSKTISHFTPNTPVVTTQPKTIASQTSVKKPLDIRPIPHPITKNIPTAPVINKPIAPTAKDIKDNAIAEVFQKISDRQKKEREAEKKRSRIITLVAALIVVIGICAFFLYISLPAISVGIASAKSGVEASFPSYSPSGYNRDGLASYDGGEVIINYKSEKNDNAFSIRQAKSSWDSSAVKNMVNDASAGKFLTTEKNGLTIFSYSGNAAWVNGGILYKISSNTPLDIAEISQIALSL